MKHVIVGSAGHVDHGKTCLIKALTGIDTDRLKEEKKRGITIELGFAYLDLPNGQRVGIVDVPGHEKFVRNMLAGAGGMDLAMLIVAADEGVMPQTVEHLDILSILGISAGVIVITKTDLVEPDFVELVEEDVRELAKGTFLETAPVVPVSAFTGEGLDELKQTLQELCLSLPERKGSGFFRMPIDRVFTLKGYGTIVTGTLWEGRMKKEQEAVLYPEQEAVRMRSIQVHSSDAEVAYAGQRVAVNLPNKKKDEIARGDILASPGCMYDTMMLDVRLTLLKHTNRKVKNGSRVHIYHGTRELLGKVILLDRDELEAGETCYVQLRLEETLAAKKGDHFVIRFYSPVETVGGGIILEASPAKHRRNNRHVLEALQIKESGNQKEILETVLGEHWGSFPSLTELAKRHSLEPGPLKNNAELLEKEGKAVRILENEGKAAQSGGDVYISRDEFDFYRKKAVRVVNEFHKNFPIKDGMGREELRSRLGLADRTWAADRILRILTDEKILKERGQVFSRYSFKVVMQEDETAILAEITEFYKNAGFAPLATEVYLQEHAKSKKFRSLYVSLVNKKTLIRLNEQYSVHIDSYNKAKEAFREMAEGGKAIQLGEFRDYLSCSRKVALALLEHFDKSGFTKKTEEGRVMAAK